MELVYILPGAAALIEWALAAALYAAGWRRLRRGFGRVGDSLVVAGMVTALADVVWRAWVGVPELALARSSLSTGLAVATLAVYAALAARRTERLSAFLILAFAVPAQAYAVGRLWWKVEVIPQEVFGPVWLALGVLSGLIGAGALGVGAAMLALAVAPEKVQGRLPMSEAVKLPVLSEWAVRLALVALSVSASLDLVRAWWGLGQAMSGRLTWLLIAWLLLAAGVVSLAQEGVSRRLSLALLVPAFVAAIGGLLTMVH